ncbi:hypothetical protein FRC09_005497 [Ceratobasidium sp. 395]|nr:hypothetical protein FRC09_005497 [Ceratobasidium sp. 395]
MPTPDDAEHTRYSSKLSCSVHNDKLSLENHAVTVIRSTPLLFLFWTALDQISVNPLGLYTTWIYGPDIKRLVELQASGKDSWAREPPSEETILEFHRDLMNAQAKKGKSEESLIVSDKTRVGFENNRGSMPDYAGSRVARINTKLIMGESANKV